MAEQNHANEEPIDYEHEWVEELKGLATKAGDKDIYVQYSFPAGYLAATGFRLQVNERTIQILLQRQSPSGLANAYLELSLPEEETAHYRKAVGDDGNVFLSVTYPYCTHHWRPGVELAEIRLSTDPGFLGLVVSAVQKQ